MLVVLDGWAYGVEQERVNAIYAASTPTFEWLVANYPNSRLVTHGEAVGLPPGQMGNSEVGHLNIGAGRVVWQDIMRIYKMIEGGELERHPVVREAIEYAVREGKPVHFIGLVSDGGVHSHIDHLKALVDIFNRGGVREIYIHAFTDGRDTDTTQGINYITELEEHIKEKARVVSVIGRYYAMDRDRRWERIKKAYDLLVHGVGERVSSAKNGIRLSYERGVSDEFIEPWVVVDERGQPMGRVRDGDVVFCFNFRTDRCRQLTEVLTQRAMPEYGMKPLSLFYITMTEYDPTYEGVRVVLRHEPLRMTLGEVLARAGLRQLRIAETEKYPHVTYFFSGGREVPFEGEERILVPSPRVPTYDLKPEMSAYEVTARLVAELNARKHHFICLNFANPDMVGHTGVFEAAVRAVEAVDDCLSRVIATALHNNYICVVTADHGNADQMLNDDGTPHTAHTTNPTPFIVVADGIKGLRDGKLGDIAPTILALMGLPVPEEMTGECLLEGFSPQATDTHRRVHGRP